MYDSRYINHIVGSKKRSILRTSFFSSSFVHVKSSAISTCFVASISFTSIGSREWRVDDMVFLSAKRRKRDGYGSNEAEPETTGCIVLR